MVQSLIPKDVSMFSADGFFIGPYDFSLSLGLPPPNPDPHPEVEQAIQNILKAAHKAGKKWSASNVVPLNINFCSSFVISAQCFAPLESKLRCARNKVSTWYGQSFSIG